MRKVKVKPARKDIEVLDDRGKPFTVSGAVVDKTVRIARLIRAGDLEVMKTAKQKGGNDE